MKFANTRAALVYSQVTCNWPSGQPEEESRLVQAIEALSSLDPREEVFLGYCHLSDADRVADRLDYLRKRLVAVRRRNKALISVSIQSNS